MKPETVHLLAQVIRHQRGLLTAFDKWVRRQEWCWTTAEGDEFVAMIGKYRDELTRFESWLGKTEIDL